MGTLAELNQTPPKILLWGRPGTGKTPFVTSYGKGMQFLDLDNGLLSSRKFQDKFTADRQQIDVIQCLESDPEKALAWTKVKKTIADIVSQCNKGTYSFEVLGIDSFTAMAGFALRYIQFNSGVINNPGLTPRTATMSQPMWGLAISEITNLFTYIRALPIPVITIFHTQEATDENDKEYEKIAIFGKNLPGSLIAYFDEIYKQKVRTVSGKMEPYLQTTSDAYTVARSRGSLPDGTKTDMGMKALLTTIGWTAKPATLSSPPSPPK